MKVFSVAGVTINGEVIERFIKTDSYDIAISNFTYNQEEEFNRILIKRVHPSLFKQKKEILVDKLVNIITFGDKKYFQLKYKNLNGKYKNYYIYALSYDDAVIAFIRKKMKKEGANSISSFSFDIFRINKKPGKKKVIKG